ncbi:C4-dicarboxylate ABC transporter substrate-binding protein [Salinivibrio kushneri]|uniref:C4-dicarboxylate ABC transporter substrate-binding protein n=1 Tax=Salinivibrio kushneri TaxID=1908198 RepID=A0AB36K615_9GAMM|nr:TRAP transporter substrate-binding protein DctP [Salinivibrio kushneri]OOE43416.1 C4-dicarboxylate ABC transporter substrate-binding protein [Salinivibrio kushneri]OOE45352.1 C4-dicarboxylate ABC transporter substrate-binding protein [Salinivibrio kushneri]
MKKTLMSLATASILAAGAANAADYKLTVPHVTSTSSYNHQSLLVFKNYVESRSNSQIEVDIYPSGQLCSNAKECLAGVQAGMFDYFQTTIPELGNFWEPVGAFDLPYMLPNDRVAECVYDNEKFIGDVRDELLKKAPNVRLMAVSNSGGWRNIATTNKQVKSPEDVEGLKLRTVPAKVQQELVKELGGAPTPIAWPEVYTALSTGMVDGTKNGVVDIIMNKFHESLGYMILDGHGYMGGAWVFNDRKFNSFPDDLKKVVIDGIAAQNQYLRSYPKHKEYSAYQEFKKADGVIYNPSAAEKEAFKEAAAPVKGLFLKSAGDEGQKWLDRFENEIKTCEQSIQADYDIQFN